MEEGFTQMADNKIIVYHGSLDKTPPHQAVRNALTSRAKFLANNPILADNPIHAYKPKPGFHAGTINAALERVGFLKVGDLESSIDGGYEPSYKAYMHAYEVPKKHVSLMTFEDPDNQAYDEVTTADDYVEALQVKEHRTDKVNKYKNRWEDKGSLSYVIPHNLVQRGGVRHLNTQQFDVHPDDVYANRDTLIQNTKLKR